MGDMMLHAIHRQARRLGRARRDEIRMKIAGGRFPARRRGSTSDGGSSRRGTRIVSRSSRSPICCETKASRPRVIVTVFLRSRAGGEHARPVGAEVDRLGHEAARAAQKAGAPSMHAHRRESSARDDDRAVMGDDEIGDAVEACGARRRRRRPAARRRDWRWSRRARDRDGASRQARTSGDPASACRTSQCSGV